MYKEKKSVNPLVFENEMKSVTRTLSRDGGLQVFIQGDQATADEGIVTLPAIDRTKNLSIREAKVARGYVDHESAHQRWTDLEGQWMKKASEKSKLLAHLTNGLEDIRIEKLQIDTYPGSKDNLSETVKATLGKGVEYMESGEVEIEDKRELVPLGITIAGRETMDYNLNDEDVQKLKDIIGSKLWGLCERAAEESKTCKNTEEVFELAQRIFNSEDMKDEDGNPPPEDGEGEGPEGEGEGDSLGEMVKSGDMSKSVEEALRGEEPGGDPKEWKMDAPIPYSSVWEYDNFIDKNNKDGCYKAKEMHKGTHADYNRFKDSIIPEIGKVKTSFERYLMSKINRGWTGGLPDGFLDPRRLTGAVTGAENIFRKRDERKELDTCVSIIVDLSGSMYSGGRIKVATKACIALSESLNKLAIPFEITGHGTDENIWFDNDEDMEKYYYNINNREDYDKIPLGKGYKRTGLLKEDYRFSYNIDDYKVIFASRWERQNFHVFKDFKSSLFESEGFIGAIPNCVSGNNTDGDALLKTYERILKRPEKKKVIIVLSDGQPCGDGFSSEDEHLVNVAKFIQEKPDVFLLHIGIETGSGEKYYKNNLFISDVSDLPKEMLEKAKEIIG